VQMLRDDGSCSHGFDPHTCPVGCGDVDNVNDSMVDSDGMPCGSCGGSERVQCLRLCSSGRSADAGKDDGSNKNV
jgi:hypothetical protein